MEYIFIEIPIITITEVSQGTDNRCRKVVKNEGVPYDLGFWLRGDGLLNRARLPSVSGGGLGTGSSVDTSTPGLCLVVVASCVGCEHTVSLPVVT